jgi:hypothetical protein
MRWGSVALIATMSFASAPAFADAGAGGEEDVASLLNQLTQEWSALSTQDCVTACKAYASIRRAADRICGLEPGPRCDDARTKADDAQRRVQAACPDCQVAAARPKEDEFRAVQRAPSADANAGAVESESAPRKGGCASCSTPGERPTGDFGIVLLGAWAISRVLRKKDARADRDSV